MNPIREEAMFQVALSKPAPKRAVWLDAKCEGDAALRARLQELLAALEQPETVLQTWRDELRESPSSRQGGAKVQGFAELSSPMDAPDEAVGQTLGRIRDSNSTEAACPRFLTPRGGSRNPSNGWCNSTTPGANPVRPPSGNRNWPLSSRPPRRLRRKGRSRERNPRRIPKRPRWIGGAVQDLAVFRVAWFIAKRLGRRQPSPAFPIQVVRVSAAESQRDSVKLPRHKPPFLTGTIHPCPAA